MKIHLQNVGPIKKATIEPGKLTVLTGLNNTGKTYAMYVLWGVYNALTQEDYNFVELNELSFLTELTNELIKYNKISFKPEIILHKNETAINAFFNRQVLKTIDSIFNFHISKTNGFKISYENNYSSRKVENYNDYVNSNKNLKSINGAGYPDTDDNLLKLLESITIGNSFDLTYDPDSLDKNWLRMFKRLPNEQLDDLRQRIIPNHVIASILINYNYYLIFNSKKSFFGNSAFLPASRYGLNLTYLDVNLRNAQLMRQSKREINPLSAKEFENTIVSNYPEPIENYLQMLGEAVTDRSFMKDNHREAIFDRYFQFVKYSHDDSGRVFGTPKGSKLKLPLYALSSTDNVLYPLWLYFHNDFRFGQPLFIDEPELNLHPKNQIILARLLARLVVTERANIVISTHSDYIVREISNMMMLYQDLPQRGEIEEKFGYDPEGGERINPDEVKAYHFTTQDGQVLVEPCKINNPGGIEVPSMDSTIDTQNDCYNSLYDLIINAK